MLPEGRPHLMWTGDSWPVRGLVAAADVEAAL